MRKNLLLTLLMCWVSMLTAAAADVGSYTITFNQKFGKKDQELVPRANVVAADKTFALEDYVTEGQMFIENFSDVEGARSREELGFALALVGSPGKFTLNFSDKGKMKIQKVVINTRQDEKAAARNRLTVQFYSGASTTTVGLKDPADEDDKYVVTGESFKDIAYDCPSTFGYINKITVATTLSGAKPIIRSITVYYYKEVEAPEFHPASSEGTVHPTRDAITLTTNTPNAEMSYQIGTGAKQTYTAPFTIGETGTFEVKAWTKRTWPDGTSTEAMASTTYVVDNDASEKIAIPAIKVGDTVIPNGGHAEITTKQLVTLSCETEAAAIKYQIDGGDVVDYTAPFALGKGHHTLTVIAVAEDMVSPAEQTVSFDVDEVKTYKLVENEWEIVPGAHYVLVDPASANAMGTIKGTVQLGTKVNVSGNAVEAGSKVQVVTLEKSGNATYPYAIKVDGGYLNGGGASNSEILALSTTLSDVTMVRINHENNNYAGVNPSIVFQGSTSVTPSYERYLYRYSNGNKFTGNNSSWLGNKSYNPVYLYKLAEGESMVNQLEAPVINYNASTRTVTVVNPNSEVAQANSKVVVSVNGEQKDYEEPFTLDEAEKAGESIDYAIEATVVTNDESKYTSSTATTRTVTVVDVEPDMKEGAPSFKPETGAESVGEMAIEIVESSNLSTDFEYVTYYTVKKGDEVIVDQTAYNVGSKIALPVDWDKTEVVYTLEAWTQTTHKDQDYKSATTTATYTVKTPIKYEKVTGEWDMVPGEEYIIAYNAGDVNWALTGTQTSEAMAATKNVIPFENGDVLAAGADVAVVTLEATGDAEFPYALMVNGKYIKAGKGGASTQGLTLADAIDATTSAKVDYTGNPSVTFNVTANEGKHLYFYLKSGQMELRSADTPRALSTGWLPAYLYKKAGSALYKLSAPEIIVHSEAAVIEIVNTNTEVATANSTIMYQITSTGNSDWNDTDWKTYEKPVEYPARNKENEYTYTITAKVVGSGDRASKYIDSDETSEDFVVETTEKAPTLYAPVIKTPAGSYEYAENGENPVKVEIGFDPRNEMLATAYQIVYSLDSEISTSSPAGNYVELILANGERTREFTVRATVVPKQELLEGYYDKYQENFVINPDNIAEAKYTLVKTYPGQEKEVTIDFNDEDRMAAYEIANGYVLSGNTKDLYPTGITMTGSAKVGNGVAYGIPMNADDTNRALKVYTNNAVTFAVQNKGVIKSMEVEVYNSASTVANLFTVNVKNTPTVAGKVISINVDQQSVTLTARANAEIKNITFVYEREPLAESFDEAIETFFAAEEEAGRVDEVDCGYETIREVEIVCNMHPIVAKDEYVYVQNGGKTLKVFAEDINASNIIKSLSAKVRKGTDGLYSLIATNVVAGTETASATPEWVTLDQIGDEHVGKYLQFDFVWYDATDGKIYHRTAPIEEPVEAPMYVDSSLYGHGLSVAGATDQLVKDDYNKVYGVLENNNGENQLYVTGREIATGINAVFANGEVSVVNGKIVAPAGSHIFNTNGMEVNAEGLQPGLYIVVTPAGQTAKCLVK